jgi:septal ring factor EnvC (AmiA/AmiB activator)
MGAASTRRRAGWPAGLVLLLLGSVSVVAPQDAPPADETAERERLESVRREIGRLQSALDKVHREERSALGDLQRLDLGLDLQRRQIELLESEIEGCRREIAVTVLEVEGLRSRLDRNRRLLSGRLRALYVRGPATLDRVALTGRSPGEVAEAYRMASWLAEADGKRIETFQADLSRLRTALQVLEERESTLGALRSREMERRRELEGMRADRARLLGGIRREAEEHEKVLEEMAGTERDLQRLVGALASGAAVPREWEVGFGRFRGLLPWPVPGKVLVPFGARKSAKFDTKIPHPGVDLATSVGEPVRAVFDGVTAFSDWFKGYGNLVILDHGGGFMTVYAHASERLVAQGDQVRGGEVIARGGDTGSLEGPKLYFEIWRNGKPEDPLPWLSRR